MNEVMTIGVDLAKTVFQVHGVDAEGGVDELNETKIIDVLRG